MSKIRILATEDDTLHEEMLRITIDNIGCELIDVVYKPSDLFLKLSATMPDIILMDIDLGGELSGIELIKEVNKRYDIPVIYVTSFADSDTFKEAKKTFPAAYVVKPYKQAELQRAIELAIYNKPDKQNFKANLKSNVVANNHIYIKEDQALVKIELDAIKLIQAFDKYCFLFLEDKRHMIRARLKDLFKQLPHNHFCQVHRSYIVNTNAIDKIVLKNNKIYIAGKEIAVSKTYKTNLYSRLNTFG